MTAQSQRLPFVFNDGGRSEAGFHGQADDCVARAVAIAADLSYSEVYSAIAKGVGAERGSKGATARRGVHTGRKWFRDFMCDLGFTWFPTMHIGKGCTTHLSHGELPMGRLVVKLSKHTVAVVDGVIHDTFDPSRETEVAEADGSVRLAHRCVYGYWVLSAGPSRPQ